MSPLDSASYPLVSIIVASDQKRATLKECLQACRQQITAFEYEWIITNSSDGAGVNQKRNAGASRARGEYLLFIDDDCLLKENALSLFYQKARNTKNKKIWTSTYEDTIDLGYWGKAYNQTCNLWVKTNPFGLLGGCIFLAKKDFLEIGGFENRIVTGADDAFFAKKAFSKNFEIEVEPAQVLHACHNSFRRFMFRSLRQGIQSLRWNVSAPMASKRSYLKSLSQETPYSLWPGVLFHLAGTVIGRGFASLIRNPFKRPVTCPKV